MELSQFSMCVTVCWENVKCWYWKNGEPFVTNVGVVLLTMPFAKDTQIPSITYVSAQVFNTYTELL